ncbi:MAG TPA: caspase family protein [Planktothrix sp.]|jgi:hypothetical protein
MFSVRKSFVGLATVLSLFSSCQAKIYGQERHHGEPQKRALLIGVSKYKVFHPNENKDIPDLHTEDDINSIKNVLEKDLGFPDANIKVLSTPESTTKESILNAIDELIKETRPGDTVWIHYSGHGSRLKDSTGRKIESYDESIVPSDANLADSENMYNEIPDYQIYNLVERLANANPKLATLTFDCCYSGTITRDVKARGLTRGFPAPEDVRLYRQRGGNTMISARQPLILSPRKNILVLAAARPDQCASEYPLNAPKMGLFSYALGQCAAHAKEDKSYTYGDLLSDMTILMTDEGGRAADDTQVPQSDGDTNISMATSDLVMCQPSLTAQKDTDGLHLNAGSLQGITRGSQFQIFSKYTKNFSSARPLMLAKVSDIELNRSELQPISGSLPDTKNKDEIFKAVESTHNYTDKLRVGLVNVNPDLQRGLEGMPGCDIHELDYFQKSKGPNCQVEIIGTNSGIQVITDDKRTLWDTTKYRSTMDPSETELYLSNKLQYEATWRFFRTINNFDTKLDVRLSIVPFLRRSADRGATASVVMDQTLNDALSHHPDLEGFEPLTIASNSLSMKEGDKFLIKIENYSDRPVYIVVCDVDADGSLTQLFPEYGDEPHYTRLIAHGTYFLPKTYLIEGPAFGDERLEVLATTSRADLRPAFTRDNNRKQSATPDVPLVQSLVQIRSGSNDAGSHTRSAPMESDEGSDDWTVAKLDLHTEKR